MSWTGQRGDGRRGYHHGNLREALIGAALDLIASKGASGFTIAEAARHAGVSPAAPYRHFRDAEALLAAIALRGFDQLTAMLQQAWNEGHPNPASAFEAMGRAYLGFARDHPAYYQTMFESPLTLANFPDMQAASDRSFAALRQAADRLCASLPEGQRPPSLMMALHVWSMAHGIASLFVRASPSRRKLPMPAEELLEAGLLLYLQSLGLAGGAR